MMNKGTHDNLYPQGATDDSLKQPPDLPESVETAPPDAHVGEDPAPLDNLRKILGPLASLKLTVVLMAVSMVLIFVGTLAQVDKGIWTVMQEYFRTWFAWVPIDIFLMDNAKFHNNSIGFPWPGGYILGPALLLNLIAAHIVRFRIKARGLLLLRGLAITITGIIWIAFNPWGSTAALFGDQYQTNLPALFFALFVIFTPVVAGSFMLFSKRAGIMLIHASLILLIGSEAVTALYAVESRMVIFEGETVSHTIDIREAELAVVDHQSDGQNDIATIIPQTLIEKAAKSGETISHADIPFDITIEKWMKNASPDRGTRSNPNEYLYTEDGIGSKFPVRNVDEVSGVSSSGEVNMPAAIVRLSKNGEPLGQFTFSTSYFYESFRWVPQQVVIDGKSYDIYMRFKHIYKPYAMKLVNFSHDKYPGTETPRNFSSDVHWFATGTSEPREVHIRMNEPFRAAGETFFQADWIKPEVKDGPDRGTVLQVVKNPGADIPYIACIVGGLGLLAHFGLSLLTFLQRRLA